MFVINIIDRFDWVNFGIWNAAIATSDILYSKYNVKSYLCFQVQNLPVPDRLPQHIELIPITGRFRLNTNFKLSETIVVSHGCWRLPTRMAYQLKKNNYKWVYTPHGMLEPWSLQQKWFRKKIYYHLIEKPYSTKADIVRAVSQPEFQRLLKTYPRVIHIPNGSEPIKDIQKNWRSKPLQFLFMARLHKKKGIIPLVQGWKKSQLNNNPNFELNIVGPNDGELFNLQNELKNCNNINYKGAVYNDDKDKMLRDSHFFILPSYSEGFPTSVIEAMQYGLIPLISEGCNFPEVFNHNLALKVEPYSEQIKETLNYLLNLSLSELETISKNCQSFAANNYSIEHIADLQFQLYQQLLNN